MCFQKIYKPSRRWLQNICQGLVGARVVIFTALVTLESPGLPPELDMGQCGLLGYDLTPGVYDQGEQNREISPSIKSDTETHITASLQQLLNILEKVPIFHHEAIEIIWT